MPFILLVMLITCHHLTSKFTWARTQLLISDYFCAEHRIYLLMGKTETSPSHHNIIAPYLSLRLVTNYRDFPSGKSWLKTPVPQQGLGWGAITQPNPSLQWQNEGNKDSVMGSLKDVLPLFHCFTISWSQVRCFYLK